MIKLNYWQEKELVLNMKENKKQDSKVKTNIQEKMQNKKFIIILSLIVLIALVIGSVLGFVLLSTGDADKTIRTSKGKAKIVKSETSVIEYETFDNDLISLKIPKGWKVEVPSVDYIHYTFKVYNPNNPDYMIIFMMKLEGFNKSEAARNWQKKYYPNQAFAKLPVINPQTTESFYNVWNETAEFVNTNNVKFEYLPKLNEFSVIDNLGTNVIGGDILRATYKNSNNDLIQGLFTASVKDAGSYYVNSNIFNLFSKKIDVWSLNVYNVILMTAPDSEFNNWQSILDNCLSTLEFSDTFVNEFNKEESNILSTIQANQKVYDEMSDMIMDSWENRNNSYDIISQKQSDATLGYERVYDTDTGEIYKAYNGFTDDYDGTKYQPITDDMYTESISGTIEK